MIFESKRDLKDVVFLLHTISTGSYLPEVAPQPQEQVPVLEQLQNWAAVEPLPPLRPGPWLGSK